MVIGILFVSTGSTNDATEIDFGTTLIELVEMSKKRSFVLDSKFENQELKQPKLFDPTPTLTEGEAKTNSPLLWRGAGGEVK